MSQKITVIFNDPTAGKYSQLGESDAVMGVLDAVELVGHTFTELGFDVTTLPLKPPLSQVESTLKKLPAPLVFNLFEGWDGFPDSEAAVANLLEKYHFQFTGSPYAALLLCQNKAKEKEILRKAGIPTPDWQVLAPHTLGQFALDFPCIIKPLGEHASHGLSAASVVTNLTDLSKQIHHVALTYERDSLVESFISGREFSLLLSGYVNLKVFPIEEILYLLAPGKPRLLTYAAKWLPEDEYFTGTKVKCPAEIEPALQARLEDLARRAFQAVGCRGYARADLRQDETTGEIMVIEVNPNPDISSSGGARMQIETAGIKYTDFIKEVISIAQDKKQV
jgi:D-alanine-D-alanine ligase